MVVLLLVAHLLCAQGRAVRDHPQNLRTLSGSCDDLSSHRQLFDIVWSCLATVFACIWISVHPNVPPPDQSWLALFWHKLRIMLIAAIAPEVLACFAARQYFAAGWFSKKLGVSKMHGFFVSMGGFVSPDGHPIATKTQLDHPLVGAAYSSAIQAVKVQEILGRSKGDTLSKAIALVQTLWFVAQYLARIHQGLVITEIEVATLGFAMVNVFIWLLWWSKPLDVCLPIVVGPALEIPPGQDLPRQVVGWWQTCTGIKLRTHSPYDPTSSLSVPAFWSSVTDDRNDSLFFATLLVECIVGIIFGLVHCAAWNIAFPSTQEMSMWRASSLIIAATPAVMIAAFTPLCGLKNNTRFYWFFTVATSIMIPVYIIARLLLIILGFVALRAVPTGAFLDVNWSVYLPHM
ncbi:hypothetical protein C8R43DRAFT_953608 [Mycena crocata]|nr:hypothetical protein C8R43DRAFT_953608 [Mycena crocata]